MLADLATYRQSPDCFEHVDHSRKVDYAAGVVSVDVCVLLNQLYLLEPYKTTLAVLSDRTSYKLLKPAIVEYLILKSLIFHWSVPLKVVRSGMLMLKDEAGLILFFLFVNKSLTKPVMC